MKIDRIKEEVANIRLTSNIFLVSLFGSIAYFFTTIDFLNPHFKTLISIVGSVILFILLLIWDLRMYQKLNELEKANKED